jgi:hypothetical protein
MLQNRVLYYGLFGLLATGISVLFVPQAFTAAALSYVVYGVVMALSMFASNEVELKAWAHPFFSARAGNGAWRLIVRLGIYLLVPALLLYLVAFTGAFTLVRGFWTALALTWMPLMIGAWLNYFPARPRN